MDNNIELDDDLYIDMSQFIIMQDIKDSLDADIDYHIIDTLDNDDQGD